MFSEIKKNTYIPNSIEDLMIFCIPSALFFSNALSAGTSGKDGATGASIPAYFFSILSVVCIPFLRNLKITVLRNWMIIITIILIGQLYALYENIYLLIPFIYKSLCFLPLIIISSEFRLIKKLVKFSISSFSISLIIAIILLLLGFGTHKYIYYVSTATFVRFAGLTIEPGGFALGYTALLFLIVIKSKLLNDKIFSPLKSSVFLIPYILSISTSFLYYILLYGLVSIDNFNFKIKKLNAIVLLIFSSLVTYFIFFDRGLISIFQRLFIASDVIKENQIIYFLGNGIYTLKGAPAYLSFPYELGLFSCFLLIFFLILRIRRISFKNLLYLLISILPVIASETYGSVFLYSPLMLTIFINFNNKKKLLQGTRSN